jgi:uncharacterized membrane protein YjjB (DUF3815 family)
MDRKQGRTDEGNSSAKTFLISFGENHRLVSVLIVALLVGILSSSIAQKVLLCLVLGVTVWVAIYLLKNHGEMEPARRTGSIAPTAPQRYTSTLLLNTITHLTRIEGLIKRPRGLAARQDNS